MLFFPAHACLRGRRGAPRHGKKSALHRSLRGARCRSCAAGVDAKKEGLSGLSKEAGKLYAAGEAEAKVNDALGGNKPPPGPTGDPR